jgi:hypothetical protein
MVAAISSHTMVPLWQDPTPLEELEPVPLEELVDTQALGGLYTILGSHG